MQLKQLASYVDYGEGIKIPGPEKRLPLLAGMDALLLHVATILDDLEEAGC
jgi:hypothetical protein